LKAAVLKGPLNLSYEEVNDPICPNNGVLIKVDACGICGSDLRTYEGGSQNTVYPCIIGHEISGTIIESKDPNFMVNTRICIAPVIPCRECWYCKRGMENLCDNLRMIGTGSGISGGFAEYLSLSRDVLYRGCINILDEGMDSIGIILSETASSCLNAQENANIGMNDELVLVIGSGTVGCLHSDIAKLRGVGETIVIDVNSIKAKLAQEQGFNVLNLGSSSEELKEIVFKKTKGRGADVVICACPLGQAQVDALKLVRKGGKIIIFGGIPKGTLVPMETNLIHYKEIKIIYGASAYTPRINKMAFNLIASGKLKAEKYITHKFELKDLSSAFDKMKKGLMIKGVVIPG